MQSIVIIATVLATAAAAPAYLLAEDPHLYHAVPLTKSTFTQNSQIVDHGSTFIHTPLVPASHGKSTIIKEQVVSHDSLHPVYAYHTMPVHEVYHLPTKTTVTKSNQVVNHGGSTIVHAPIVHTPVVYHSSPLVALKSGDSAITHHSSTVHETVPVVKSLPLFAVHH